MIVCAPSSATAPPETASAVLISGSYGGVYNAWHAVRKAAKAVILSDAGVGMNRAGISGLPWLGALGIPGATADYRTCHIGDGDHILQFGKISFVNSAAAALGCAAGEPVSDCARKLECASPRVVDVPAVEGGKRYDLLQREGRPPVIGLDAAPLLVEADAGSIAVTGSHAALVRGRPDNVINVCSARPTSMTLELASTTRGLRASSTWTYVKCRLRPSPATARRSATHDPDGRQESFRM